MSSYDATHFDRPAPIFVTMTLFLQNIAMVGALALICESRMTTPIEIGIKRPFEGSRECASPD